MGDVGLPNTGVNQVHNRPTIPNGFQTTCIPRPWSCQDCTIWPIPTTERNLNPPGGGWQCSSRRPLLHFLHFFHSTTSCNISLSLENYKRRSLGSNMHQKHPHHSPKNFVKTLAHSGNKEEILSNLLQLLQFSKHMVLNLWKHNRKALTMP